MDKTAIRNFAIEARKILMKSAITEAGFYGITKDGCKDPVQKGNDFEVYETVAGTENRIFGDDIKRRANLVQAVKTLGLEQVIEETAYTWFNRIIAIRFMEVNNYLPTRVRVLSSETGSRTPDIITQVDTVELNLTSDEFEKIQTAKRENRYDDAFRMLFIKQCNELNAILPGLFEKTYDYMELLLKITYTGDGVIRMLVDSIPEDNFNVETEGQVEIIGWMYQYYNTELKDDTFAKLKKNVKITKERIPAATQLFTPDWIVRYMVENSLGRVWIEHLRAVNPFVDEKAKAEEFGWKYYLPEVEQEDDVQAQLVEIRKSYKDLTPQDITCIDPCMGSGHILVYMFDVLMDIYRSEGFSERDAVFDILEKNIRGLDIDRRAYQLSYFALMMKARGYNRIFFRGHEDSDGNRVQVMPRVYAIEESNSIDREQLKYFGAGLDELSRNNAINQMNGLLDSLYDAKEYGSILSVENYDWKLLRSYLEKMDDEGQGSLFGFMAYQSKNLIEKLIDIGEMLAGKYDSVITNPPYMNWNSMGIGLQKMVKKHYEGGKNDLFSVFMLRCMDFIKANSYFSMITQHGWMFLSSFEKVRNTVMNDDLISLVHLGTRAFEEISGEVVQTASFVFRNSHFGNSMGVYRRLVDYGTQQCKEEAFLAKSNEYIAKQSDLKKISGEPLAYWLSKTAYKSFESMSVGDNYKPRNGITTGENDLFIRMWSEVKPNENKWYRLNKGGGFRRWYGNQFYVVDWEDDGRRMKNLRDKNGKARATLRSIEYNFETAITMSRIVTGITSFRYLPEGFITEGASNNIYIDNIWNEDRYCLLAFLNSKPCDYILHIFNPTINVMPEDLRKLPLVECVDKVRVKELVKQCIDICKQDWDSFETSWDFAGHPLVSVITNNHALFEDLDNIKLSDCFNIWDKECGKRFEQLKNNEEEINRIFIELYGLQDELNECIDDKEITVRKADFERDIRSLISYAVGCMFGRYSLSEQGVICAGGELKPDRYGKYAVDKDAIIPITDEAYLEDDILGRFEEFIRIVYGAKSLESNLEYIASALGTKGTSSRDRIRTYFLNEFYKDHCNTYSVTGSGKRPIYWLFDSGKENGFKCLIYLHRYTVDMVGLIRSDYLTKIQGMIENALRNAEYAINTSASAVDKAQATKKRDKYIKQLAEIRAYYPALSHIALQRIELDLDDGVKANYAKFQGIEVSVEGEKKQKVDLLAKI